MITEQALQTNREELCKRLGTSKIYTQQEFQQMFNISTPYIYKLQKLGRIPQFRGKIGRLTFYSQEDINDIIESGELKQKMLLGESVDAS